MALIMAVIAMVVLGVMIFSFTILGGLEARIGLHDVRAKQAVTTAEAGFQAVRNQVQNPPDYTAFIGHEYTCDTATCTCTGTGCATSRLARVSTGSFRVRVDNDPDDADPAVDTNKRVVLTALGTTTDGKGHARMRAWLTNDDPWKHVCASGDGVLCTEPPNNENAEVTPPDPNDLNGPKTYPQIPRPNNIRTTPNPGGPFNDATNPDAYPVPMGLTYAQVPTSLRGPWVMYPYYEIALKTPCPMCNPPTQAYDPVTCNTGDACLGMVRFDADLTIRSGTSATNVLGVTGGVLAGTLYVTGKVTFKNSVGTVNGTIIFHGGADPGQGGAQTDLSFDGPHTVQTVGGCLPNCAYPLVILGYNPNEPPPPDQTLFLDISNNGVQITGVLYTGGTVDFGPNTIDGSILGQTVNANNAATEFTYTSTYENYVPPPGFDSPALSLPSVVARGTWIQCRRADDPDLSTPCD
jgi:hypothetical protein